MGREEGKEEGREREERLQPPPLKKTSIPVAATADLLIWTPIL